MELVTPSVQLLARPKIDWEEVEDYLVGVGGEDWKTRIFLDDFLDDDHSGEHLIEFGGRLCYRSWAPGLNANVRQVRTDSHDYLTNILHSGHGSVLEHANYTFLFSNVSRVFTHELVRHRAGTAFSQESMRFVRLTEIPFWFPTWAQDDPELMEKATSLLLQMEEFQLWMADHFGLDNPGVKFGEKKHKTSFMRRFAPDGVATSIVMTANIRALRHMITMRTDHAAEEEIQVVFEKVMHIMVEEAPTLFGDFIPSPTRTNNTHAWVPESRKV